MRTPWTYQEWYIEWTMWGIGWRTRWGRGWELNERVFFVGPFRIVLVCEDSDETDVA